MPTFAPSVQLWLGGAWIDITDNDVLARDSLTIVRGRSDWSSQVQPSRATMSLKNPNGRWSPRHPASPWFGTLGRNTPIKIFMDGECRFHGEVSEWPQRAEPDRYVPIEAAGVLRRLSSSDIDPLRSVLYRTMMQPGGLQTPVAYWPMEEESGTLRLYSAVPRNTPIRVDSQVQVAGYSGIAASAPIPVSNNRQFYADIAPHTPNATMTAMCLVHIPDSGLAANGTPIMVANTTGSARYWRVRGNINRTVNILVTDASGGTILSSVDTPFTLAPEGAILLLELTTNGSDVDWSLRVLNVGRTAASTDSGTVSGRSYNRINRLTFGSNGNLGDTAIGHAALFTGTVDDDILLEAVRAHAGETAGRRIERLCLEEGVAFAGVGDLDDTMRMGTQGRNTLLQLLTECAEADGGILHEPLEMPSGTTPGLGYRGLADLYNAATTLELDVNEGQVGLPFEPTDDDQLLANDVTVTRQGGATFRTTIDDGPMGVDTIGRKRGGGTVNPEADLDAEQISGWQAHLGTWNETRIPQLTVSLTRNPDLAGQVCAVDMGHRITLLNPPPWLPPDDIELMAQGYTENLDAKTWRVVYNCTPWRPYQVVRLDSGPVKKFSPFDSQLASGITETATTMSVESASGRWPWTTSSAQMPIPIRVDGEVMSVTAISGASSPQTFTVIRGVNGYPSSHLAGAAVTLVDRATLGL